MRHEHRRHIAALLAVLVAGLLALTGTAFAQDHGAELPVSGAAQTGEEVTGVEETTGAEATLTEEHATEEDEHAADPSSLVQPLWDEFIPALIAFALLFLVMAKVAFPGLRKALAGREAAIKGELEKAEKARLDAEEEAERYRRQMAEQRAQADQVVKEAAGAAEDVRRDLVAKAEEEARQIVEKARTDAHLERDRVLAELRREVASLSLEAAKRVVGKELENPDAQRALVEQFIAEVGSQN